MVWDFSGLFGSKLSAEDAAVLARTEGKAPTEPNWDHAALKAERSYPLPPPGIRSLQLWLMLDIISLMTTRKTFTQSGDGDPVALSEYLRPLTEIMLVRDVEGPTLSVEELQIIRKKLAATCDITSSMLHEVPLYLAPRKKKARVTSGGGGQQPKAQSEKKGKPVSMNNKPGKYSLSGPERHCAPDVRGGPTRVRVCTTADVRHGQEATPRQVVRAHGALPDATSGRPSAEPEPRTPAPHTAPEEVSNDIEDGWDELPAPGRVIALTSPRPEATQAQSPAQVAFTPTPGGDNPSPAPAKTILGIPTRWVATPCKKRRPNQLAEFRAHVAEVLGPVRVLWSETPLDSVADALSRDTSMDTVRVDGTKFWVPHNRAPLVIPDWVPWAHQDVESTPRLVPHPECLGKVQAYRGKSRRLLRWAKERAANDDPVAWGDDAPDFDSGLHNIALSPVETITIGGSLTVTPQGSVVDIIARWLALPAAIRPPSLSFCAPDSKYIPYFWTVLGDRGILITERDCRWTMSFDLAEADQIERAARTAALANRLGRARRNAGEVKRAGIFERDELAKLTTAAMILMMMVTGARPSEMKWRYQQITNLSGKQSNNVSLAEKSITVDLRTWASDVGRAIKRYITLLEQHYRRSEERPHALTPVFPPVHPEADFLSSDIAGMMNRLLHDMNKQKTAYSGRRTFVTRFSNEGKSLEELRRIQNYGSESTVVGYIEKGAETQFLEGISDFPDSPESQRTSESE
ncbi:hypothetical protein J8273_7667 [Carpediemonas membranifera]|uniref:Phage integrase family protein n=1 Tax=Carpediemonas membranifera TaxID=201153 RepID=A0A8J6DXK4_9EUKA|nr:hypothetical protein J8273_7667 [Carpediemonas membranifera]|eukprot:KAG9390324.1 hypothetical protein J8273_7667 [Carpediemonas membranifera]